MLFQFCKLCCNNVDSTFIKFSRHYARALVNKKQREIQTKDDVEEKNKTMVPIIKCKRKSFNFYKGQTYSKHEKILLASKGWQHRLSKGDYFFIYPDDNEVKVEESKELDFGTFNDFNLEPSIYDSLQNTEFKKPLQIQHLAIPKILEGHNIVLAAETGCGKTLAYLLPMIHRILQWKQITYRDKNCPLGLIVTPTRELAVQIALEAIKLCKPLGVQIKMITGGNTMKIMQDPPVDYVDILVGSFGVLSKLTTFHVYKLDFVRFIVLDEADALFHYTFEDKLKVFMEKLAVGDCQENDKQKLPQTAQLILASATIPARTQQVLNDIVNVKSLLYIQTEKLHKILVEQKFMRMGKSDKPAELLKYIKPKAARNQPVIVFCNTNSTSYWLYLFLNECGIKTTILNGTMPLSLRRGKYGEFINGKVNVLSTTNAGSRGLDTVMANHVLNYDFPLDTASYIHRCGRTQRVGTKGNCRVTHFISTELEVVFVRKIEYSVRKQKPLPIVDFGDPYKNEEDMKAKDENDANDTEFYEEFEEEVQDIDKAEHIPF
ncbi:probable ATP-dependent RNA helicase DDX28 [Hylaeus anthracinus]|uniref:probable ATP-dependent RNA helicase DDX28 n=1 Tax=Hylaeus anthracinus TaxID=313031 RepID=UPI0023B95D29|nr:probable ATP-dependent RNA helicase DDX28 [Hylaeus anthracinus]